MLLTSAEIPTPLLTGAITLAIQTLFYVLKDRDPYIRGLERRTKEYSYLKAQREAHELAGTEPPEHEKQRLLDYIQRSSRWYELNHTEAAKNARWLSLLTTCFVMAYVCAKILPAMPAAPTSTIPFLAVAQELGLIGGIAYCYMDLYQRIRRFLTGLLLELGKKHARSSYLTGRRED